MSQAARNLVVLSVIESALLALCVAGFVSTGDRMWLYLAGAVAAVFVLVILRQLPALSRERRAGAGEADGNR